MITLPRFIRSCESAISGAEHTLAKFKDRLERDPHDAFTWAKEAQEAAATLSLYRSLYAWAASGEMKLAGLRAQAEGRVLQGARYVPSSSSMQSNLSEAYMTAAWASLVTHLRMNTNSDQDEFAEEAVK